MTRSVLIVVGLGMLVTHARAGEEQGSYLCQPAFRVDDLLRLPAEPYAPKPGDIMLVADDHPLWRLWFHMAFSGKPYHSGIVMARPDGRLAVLEAGPHDTTKVIIADVLPEMRSYAQTGLVWIRRRRCPLTPEESARLTEFALAQEGKRFAIARIVLQITPLRTRGPLRTAFIGRPHGERDSYICSEVVLEACVAAGLLDAETTRPSATYPRDLFLERSPNPYLREHLDLNRDWLPPARWIGEPPD